MSVGLLLMALLLTPREDVRQQMRQRPQDPWPRGAGHVVLAWPGSAEADKAYHEPGGSFSPAVGSFGVSIWVEGGATSDSLPLEQIRQSLFWPPGVFTETRFYEAAWISEKPGAWTLRLSASQSPRPAALAVRSVGPAGGPLRSLDWDGRRLLVNGRWSLSLDPAPVRVHLGEEGGEDWREQADDRARYSSESGWAWARFDLGRADALPGAKLSPERGTAYRWTLRLTDANTPLRPADLQPLDVSLPEPRFQACLNAQVAHLLMGLVDDQTRPGDPTNYPLPWLRDGAYVVVALARSGQLDIARRLTRYFAENDFFGGFGSEADAPGLALWALEEVAVRSTRSEFDLWPHVRRKADLILNMLSSESAVHAPFIGPIVPKHRDCTDLTLVAEPARDGLIVGRMDHHRPLLFVNSVSYRGLLDAAAFADRAGQRADAQRWRTAASSLQAAWERAFHPPESDNDRTWIGGLWPSGIAAGVRKAFEQGLEARWQRLRDEKGNFRLLPLWTYFDVAEAHQWLLLGQADRAWQTLRWLWDHQASPGLYTWWEGRGEENTFGLWEQVRGWIDPPHVTPHYWTAAEMLLLQMDMLTRVDPASGAVVIGAGVPPEWKTKPMSARGIVTPYGPLDWSWDGKRMLVRAKGNRPKVELGPAFPPGTAVEWEKP